MIPLGFVMAVEWHQRKCLWNPSVVAGWNRNVDSSDAVYSQPMLPAIFASPAGMLITLQERSSCLISWRRRKEIGRFFASLSFRRTRLIWVWN